MDVRWRGRRSQRPQGGPRRPGCHLAGHARRRRRRHRGDDRAARARHRRQCADRRANAGLRHSGLGRRGRARRSQRRCRERGLGRCRAGGAPALRQVRRQVDFGPGQRALDQLGLGQQGDPGRARHRRARHLGRAGGRARRDPGRWLRRPRPRRPGLAGSHDLRRRPDVHGRDRILSAVHGRS